MAWINVVTKPETGKGRPTSFNTDNVFAVTEDEDGDAVIITITGHRIATDKAFVTVLEAIAQSELIMAMEDEDDD